MTIRNLINLIEGHNEEFVTEKISALVADGQHEGFQPYWKLLADERVLSDADAMNHIATLIADGFLSGAHPHWELKVLESNHGYSDDYDMADAIGDVHADLEEEVIDKVHAHMVVPVAETHGPGNGWFEVPESQATLFVVEDDKGDVVDSFSHKADAQGLADSLNAGLTPADMSHHAAPVPEPKNMEDIHHEVALDEVDEDPTDVASHMADLPDVPTMFDKSQNFVVIINAIHERGERQQEALKELGKRGLWLSPEQKEQAGL